MPHEGQTAGSGGRTTSIHLRKYSACTACARRVLCEFSKAVRSVCLARRCRAYSALHGAGKTAHNPHQSTQCRPAATDHRFTNVAMRVWLAWCHLASTLDLVSFCAFAACDHPRIHARSRKSCLRFTTLPVDAIVLVNLRHALQRRKTDTTGHLVSERMHERGNVHPLSISDLCTVANAARENSQDTHKNGLEASVRNWKSLILRALRIAPYRRRGGFSWSTR